MSKDAKREIGKVNSGLKPSALPNSFCIDKNHLIVAIVSLGNFILIRTGVIFTKMAFKGINGDIDIICFPCPMNKIIKKQMMVSLDEKIRIIDYTHSYFVK